MNTLLVAAAGLIAGLLLAPRTGKENRELLKERFSSLRETLMRKESPNGEGSGEEGLESTGRADYLH
jgi:gas vesicle protein